MHFDQTVHLEQTSHKDKVYKNLTKLAKLSGKNPHQELFLIYFFIILCFYFFFIVESITYVPPKK